jgi:Tol biopolymer transport system component
MSDGAHQLWIRNLDDEPRPIPGTHGASYPFWSPDSKWVAFFADGLLKKVGLDGRAPREICPAPSGRGGAWGAHDTVVFAPQTESGLSRVNASGGAPVRLTVRGPSHYDHRWPHFLPDGRVLFFVRSSDPGVEGLYVVSLEKPSELHRVRATSSSGLYASGWLLFLDETELMAVPLDLQALQLTGEAVPVGLKVTASSGSHSAMSASSDGVLATWSTPAALGELRWFDRRGTPLGAQGPPGRYVDFRLSPDGKSIAVSRVEANTKSADLAVQDLASGVFSPLSASPRTDASPVWSPDSSRLVFRSSRHGNNALFQVPAHGRGERLIHGSDAAYPTSWLEDTILFHARRAATGYDIRALDSSGAARGVVETPASEVQGQLAPGGRLAYTSDVSGSFEVHVRPFDGKTGATTVSLRGGFDPRWRRDGLELFFIAADGFLNAVDVHGGYPLSVGTRRQLFQTGVQSPGPPYATSFDVTADGQQFLINTPLQPSGAGPITVTLDWTTRIH